MRRGDSGVESMKHLSPSTARQGAAAKGTINARQVTTATVPPCGQVSDERDVRDLLGERSIRPHEATYRDPTKSSDPTPDLRPVGSRKRPSAETIAGGASLRRGAEPWFIQRIDGLLVRRLIR